MWTTFSKNAPTQKTLVPGTFNTVSTVTVPAAVGGIALVPLDATNNVRFVNISVAPTADSNGDPISIYIGVKIRIVRNLLFLIQHCPVADKGDRIFHNANWRFV